MTTAAFNAMQKPLSQAITAVKKQYCSEPRYAPEAEVSSHMTCPRCKSRLNFTVLINGMTSGQCVASSCLRWNLQ